MPNSARVRMGRTTLAAAGVAVVMMFSGLPSSAVVAGAEPGSSSPTPSASISPRATSVTTPSASAGASASSETSVTTPGPQSSAPSSPASAPSAPSPSTPSPSAPKPSVPSSVRLTGAPAARGAQPRATTLDAAISFTCQTGYVYAIGDRGQLQQISSTGAVTTVGDAPRGLDTRPESPVVGDTGEVQTIDKFNGMGITADGTTAYAVGWSTTQTVEYARGIFGVGWQRVGRPSGNVTIWKYDGTWTDTGIPASDDFTDNWLAGAVNLKTGNFVFGGYATADRFDIYEYNPTTNRVAHKGYLPISRTNGDMALDSDGNLFVVGSSTSTRIYSVKATDYDSATGGRMAYTQLTAGSQLTNVNGVAFDDNGQGYLSNGRTLGSYAMPGWADGHTVTTSLQNSVDLATCSAPPTVTIKKFVDDRVNDGDQFTLTLSQNGQELSRATTAGTTSGIQPEQMGPFPAGRNVQLTIAEIPANSGTSLGDYVSSYRCTVNDDENKQFDQGDGTSGSFTIPTWWPSPTAEDRVRVKSVVCTFHNSPLVTHVTVTKKVIDAPGAQPQPASGWGMSISPTSIVGSVTLDPADDATSKTTGDDGAVSWSLKYATKADRAAVTVKETQRDGYRIESARCVVTPPDGVTKTVEATSETVSLDATTLEGLGGVAPGSSVDCTFINEKSPGTLAITKKFDATLTGVTSTATFTGDYVCTIPNQDDVTGTWRVTGQGPADLTPSGETTPSREVTLPVGATCSVTETAPAKGSTTGLPLGYAWQPATVSGVVTIDSGATRTVTVTNSVDTRDGSVIWTKVDGSHARLAGSEWTLKGPAGFTTLFIADNGTSDMNKSDGEFRVDNLPWGEYTLTETKAPSGYILKTDPITFIVDAGAFKDANSLTIDQGEIENSPRSEIIVPLTGGMGSDYLYLTGGGLLLTAAGLGAYIRRRNARPGARA